MEDVKIAREKTRADWKTRKGELITNKELWSLTFDDFFQARVESRYFTPIEKICNHKAVSSGNTSIASDDPYSGEGFAVVALLFSLIEFLETCRTGSIFTTVKGISNSYPALGPPYHYGTGASQKIFTKFLKDSLHLSDDDALCLYKKVRCAILHNAMTDDPWVIRVAKSGTDKIVDSIGAMKVLYRDILYKKLREYIADYKADLMHDDSLKDAFIRKFDSL